MTSSEVVWAALCFCGGEPEEMRVATTEPWMVVTPERLKQGWVEYGHAPRHREFDVIAKLEDGDYVVRNPRLVVAEEEMRIG